MTPDVSQNASTAVAIEAVHSYGFTVNSVVGYRRIDYPSKSAVLSSKTNAGQVYLLGETVSGIGLALATEYVPYQIQEWFGSP